MKQGFFVLSIAVCLGSGLHQATAQQLMPISRLSHDFGTHYTDEAPLATTFLWVYLSEQPLDSLIVQAECGCTDVQLSSYTLRQYDTLRMKVTYDPYNRPGPFEKRIELRGEGYLSEARISGAIRPEALRQADQWPVQRGQVSLSHKTLDLGHRSPENPVEAGLFIKNTQADTLSLTVRSQWLTPASDTVRVPPQAEGSVRLAASEPLAWGFHLDTLVLAWPADSAVVPVSLLYLPEPGDSTAEKLPELWMEEPGDNYPEVREGALYRRVLTVENRGRADLQFYAVQTLFPFLALEYPEVLGPRDEGSIICTVTTEGLRDYQSPVFYVCTNDPKTPVLQVMLRVEVEER